MKIARISLLLFLLVAPACSDEGGAPDAQGADANARDAQPRDADAGVYEPDYDSDSVPDSRDNCLGIPNTDQGDEDEDGLGDICDSCPSTPNAEAQTACSSLVELEPNDTATTAMELPFPAIGEIVEVRGFIESGGSTQALDRFRLYREILDERVLHVRVARRGSTSTLEPAFDFARSNYTLEDRTLRNGFGVVPREADGEMVAERDVYSPSYIAWELRVGDRRGMRGNDPRGGPGFEYVLTVESRSFDAVEDLGTVARDPTPVQRTFSFDPKGSLKRVQVMLPEWRLDRPPGGYRFDLEGAPGFDPIISEGEYENDNADYDTVSARILATSGDSTGPVPLILDHRRIDGDDLTATLTITWTGVLDIEPNNTPDQAQTVMHGDVAYGWFGDPAPDEDWYRIRQRAGRRLRFGCQNVLRGGVEPIRQIYRIGSAGLEEEVYWGYVIAYEDSDYAVRVTHRGNAQPPYESWPAERLYRYECAVESLSLLHFGFQSQISRTTTLRGRFPDSPALYGVDAPNPIRFDAVTTSTTAGIRPLLRIYGPNGIGLLGVGTSTLGIDLDASPQPYVLGVFDDGEVGKGMFTIRVTIAPR